MFLYQKPLDQETEAWLSAELTPPLPPYDWGPTGEPAGQLLEYVPGQGVIIPDAPKSQLQEERRCSN